MYKYIALATFLAVFCFSSVSCDCPNVPTFRNLDLSKYLGIWYEMERFPLINENELRCVTAHYTLYNSTYVLVNNSGINEKTNKFEDAIGSAYAPDPKDPSKLIVTFGYGPIQVGSDYWVLLTDYNTYSLVYSCRMAFNIKFEFAWILSRTRSLDPNVINTLRNYLKTNGVDPEQFMVTNNNNC